MNTTRTSLLSIVLIFVISTICSINMVAQDNKDAFERYRQMVESKFETTKAKHDKRFDNYRDSVNNAYSLYLQREWEQTSLNKSRPTPVKPEPKPILDTTTIVSSKPLPHVEPEPTPDTPVSAPKPIASPTADSTPNIPPVEPDRPIIDIEKSVPQADLFSFDFYGVTCKVHLPATKELKLQNTSNQEISRVWDILSAGAYDKFLNDCIAYRKELQLCDWGLHQFVSSASEAYFGNSDKNESILLQMYALSQLGYKIRLGMQGERLINLVAFNQQIYAKPYLTIEGKEFYFLSTGLKEGGIRLCDFTFPNEQVASLHIKSLPKLPSDPTPKRQIKSTVYPNVAVSVSVNNNLIKFLNTYPCCSCELFAEASLSSEVKEQLYPALRKSISNLSEKEAANILLNLIQTGFEYQTDDEQFGREKTFFGDEPFYYPYCDCEDRSVLYAILIKDLLNLDVVLLDYPSHIATAVCFNENISGDYVNLNGKKYIICDPTYIGAPIGKSMPEMLKYEANILRIE